MSTRKKIYHAAVLLSKLHKYIIQFTPVPVDSSPRYEFCYIPLGQDIRLTNGKMNIPEGRTAWDPQTIPVLAI